MTNHDNATWEDVSRLLDELLQKNLLLLEELRAYKAQTSHRTDTIVTTSQHPTAGQNQQGSPDLAN